MISLSLHAERMRIAIAVALLIAAPAAAAGDAGSDEVIRSRATTLLAPFKQALQQSLVQGLARGPVAAVESCHAEAAGLARAHAQDGILMGRSSHRLRNPNNAAPDWVQPILDRYVSDPLDRRPSTVSLRDGRSGYVEPILLKPLCVTCHGETLAPALAERIAELYPEDRATGFRPGELRGVFWVELPPTP
jgi:hypothetical protein